MSKPTLKMSRRRFFGGVSFLAAGTAGYARFIESEWLETCFVTVSLSGGRRQPLKLLHISDLHASGVVALSYIERSIDHALSLRPDVICVTGDFITGKYERRAEYAQVLQRLSECAPSFACLGNHDGGKWSIKNDGYHDSKWVTSLLEEGRLPLLHNASSTVRIRDWNLNFVGLGDAWSGQYDEAAAFSKVKAAADDTTVVLVHNPDTKDDLAKFHWDLMLCGHTHGGQFRMPLIGTPFAPVRDKRYVAGLYRWNGRWLHVTKGIGNVCGVRINCPPDVTLLTLT